MKCIIDQRVFFKRQALARLQEYWCNRWDELILRETLSKNYTPRYFVESEHLDGLYIKLRGIDFLWFRGLFSVGKHLKSGVYYRDPVHLSLKGLGPRQIVFPFVLVEHLEQLALLGDWTRYQLCAKGWINEERSLVRVPKRGNQRLVLNVTQVKLGQHQPILSRWGRKTCKIETVCLIGNVVDGRLKSYEVEVPISEVYWNNFTKTAV
ncbi:MAG: hypothetical protein AAF490_25455 [Chloroflexota bacterium]